MKSYRAPAFFQQGRYIPNKVLGTGTYGQVIRCLDAVTGQDVAVKVAQSDAAYRRSALNEISALLCLKDNHDSVSILDSFEDAGHVCIVSELLDRNLFEVLRHRGFAPLSLREVRQVALHVLNALAALHNSGYIHCDIKPENIMLRCNTPATSNVPSPVLGPFGSDNSSSGSSNKSGEQNNYPNALAPGQEMHKMDPKANAHNQLWRNSNAIDTLVGNPHGISFFDADLNNGFSPRSNARHGGFPPQQHQQHQQLQGHRVSSDGNGSMGNVSMRQTNSLDALFGASSATAVAYGSSRNDAREDCNERRPRNPAANPYCRTCLIDFGAVRRFNENTYYDVQSLWYRAPEVLCGLPYTTAIDSWSVGCVLFELFTGKPFFPGESPQQQLSLIVQHVGHPSHAAMTMGCLTAQFQLPLAYVSPEARREHVRQWVVSSREAGLQRWRKHQMQKLQGAHNATNQQLWSRRAAAAAAAEAASAKAEEDPLLTATPYCDADVDGTSEELELLVDLICDLLHPDEAQRLSCTQALRHPFLNTAPMCCNATPCPYTATPAASFPCASAAPQPVPCIMATTATGHPVMVTTSPVSVSVGCSPVSPFVVHPMHATAASFAVAQADPMLGVEMKVSPLGMAGGQPFSTHPNMAATAVYAAAPAGQVMQCALPVYSPVAHRVPAANAGPTFLPLGMTPQSTMNSAYCSPSATSSSQQHPSSGVNISPNFPTAASLGHQHVPLGYTPNAMAGGGVATGATGMQPLGAPSYVLANANGMPCMRDYGADAAPAGMSPYVICHFSSHHPCATVVSP